MDRAFRLSLEYDNQQNKMKNGIPLVVTYNPAFKNLATTLPKNFNILYSVAEVRTVFTRNPFIAYTANSKFSRRQIFSLRFSK